MGKLPSFQFYPGDWLRDTVSGCSLAAQGLWLRLMIQMHDSERYGYLGVDGKPLPDEVLARRCGCSINEYRGLLEELERAGVLGRTAEGIIFSRRMVRDAKAREAAAHRQRKHRHGPVTPLSQLSSSSSSSSKHTLAPTAPRCSAPPTTKPIPGFEEFWKLYPRKEAKKDAIRAWKKVRPDEVPVILAAIERFKATDQWRRGIIPHPATFLNGRRWEDEMLKPTAEEIPLMEPYR